MRRLSSDSDSPAPARPSRAWSTSTCIARTCGGVSGTCRRRTRATTAAGQAARPRNGLGLQQRLKGARISNQTSLTSNSEHRSCHAGRKDPGMPFVDVDAELAAVWRGYDHGVVTEEEVHQRLDELERLLWRQVFQRL